MKNLKTVLITGFILFTIQSGFGQSPSYSIEVKITPEKGYGYSYSSMLCMPNTSTLGEDLFSGATSGIDWSIVDIVGYSCNELQNETEDGYKYGNQIYVYESIANVTIVRTDGELLDIMQIVFPFAKESFVTHVDLTGIEFRPGIYELTNAFEYDTSNHLVMRLKEGHEWVKVEESNLLSAD
jgi:hypothetical protein